MSFRINPKMLPAAFLVTIAMMGSTRAVHAQEEFVSHWTGWAVPPDVSNSGLITASAMQGGWIETIDPPNTTTVYAYFALVVDGQLINSYSIMEGQMINGPDTLSRDPNNQDVVPISWQHQLTTPGPHTIVFYGYIY